MGNPHVPTHDSQVPLTPDLDSWTGRADVVAVTEKQEGDPDHSLPNHCSHYVDIRPLNNAHAHTSTASCPFCPTMVVQLTQYHIILLDLVAVQPEDLLPKAHLPI